MERNGKFLLQQSFLLSREACQQSSPERGHDRQPRYSSQLLLTTPPPLLQLLQFSFETFFTFTLRPISFSAFKQFINLTLDAFTLNAFKEKIISSPCVTSMPSSFQAFFILSPSSYSIFNEKRLTFSLGFSSLTIPLSSIRITS